MIRIDPDNANSYAGRGSAYFGLSQYDKAIADYTEAIRLNPDYALAYSSRGVAYLQLGNDVKADADRAIAIELGYEP